MDSFKRSRFTAKLTSGHDVTHDVYTRGAGPVVVIIQELPGIGPQTLRLAELFDAQGFTVVLPHLFGPLGKTSLLGNTARVFCMRREFRLFAKGKTSPIVGWLRALCQDLKAVHQVEGVAVIGMCLTGNFAISLMADDAVLAAVASQPSMPIGGAKHIHMAADDIEVVHERLEEIGPMLAYRFEQDKLCRAEKFATLDAAFNDKQERIKLNTLPGPGHSVFTLDFVDEDGHPTREALDEVLAYFRAALPAAKDGG